VVGGSRLGKEGEVNMGELAGQEAGRSPSAVRAAIGAKKSGNADGAKGGRKVNPGSNRTCEVTSSTVPATDKQGEEDLWQCYKAKHGVWSEGMLEALERGVKGGNWFSLIDKVYAERTLAMGWEQVKSNSGACGVDGITVKVFAKDSQRRLLAVREQIKEDRYWAQLIKRYFDVSVCTASLLTWWQNVTFWVPAGDVAGNRWSPFG